MIDNLRRLEDAVWHDDPRFVAGLRTGHPVAPREHRQRRLRWCVTLLVAAEALLLVLGLDWLAVGSGFGAVVAGRLR